MFYLLNFIAVIIYYQLLGVMYGDTQKRKKYFAIMVGIHAILFRALANPFNYVDTGAYAEAYRYFTHQSFQHLIIDENSYTNWGRGYLFWNWILAKISTNYNTLFIASSILGVGPVIWFYYKTAPKMLFPILIYLAYPMMYLMGFGVLRQHLSVAFILLAVYFADDLKKSLPLAVIASLMHTSGIVIFPFYIWKRINLHSKISFKLAFYIILGLIIVRLLMGYILSYMPKYEMVLQGEATNNRLPVIWLSCITIASLVLQTYKRTQFRVEEIIISFLYYGLLVSIFCMGLPGMGRFAMCFQYIAPVASAIIIRYSKNLPMNILVVLANVVVTLFHLQASDFIIDVNNNIYTFFWE
jgi:hypothetical protein